MMTSQYLKHCQKVPDWMQAKVLALATARNDIMELRSGALVEPMKSVPRGRVIESLLELEHEAAIMLRADLHLNPELACLLPKEFVKALRVSSSGLNLAPLERASIVIAGSDAREAIGNLQLDYDEVKGEFTRLKWVALASLLKEAACE